MFKKNDKRKTYKRKRYKPKTGKLSNYSMGIMAENKVADYLESQDYVVIQSAGSRGSADLIAIDKHLYIPPLFVQCKSTSKKNKNPANPSQRVQDELFYDAYIYNAIPVIAKVNNSTNRLTFERVI
jgi:hypothetical protein